MKALATADNQSVIDSGVNTAALESLRYAWLATMNGKAATTQKTYAKVMSILFDWLKENKIRSVDNLTLNDFNKSLAGKSDSTQKLYSVVTKKFFSYVCKRAGLADFTPLVDRIEISNAEIHKRGALDETQAKAVLNVGKDAQKDIGVLKMAAAQIVAYECNLKSVNGILFKPGDYQRRSNRHYLKIWKGNKFEWTRLSSLANSAVTEFYKERLESMRDNLMVEIMTKIGLRTIEITRLAVDSVSTSHGKPILKVIGKGRKAPEPVIITPALKRKIEEYLTYRADVKAKVDAGNKAPMFPSLSKRNYGGTLDTSTVAKAATRALEQVNAESEEKFSAHSLRHTAACIALKKTGYNLEKVRQMLRHKNVAVTSIYINDLEFWENDATKQIELALED